MIFKGKRIEIVRKKRRDGTLNYMKELIYTDLFFSQKD
jgi:hypothetical protein